MLSVRNEDTVVRTKLGLWDATSLVVGIIIGVGIFETPTKIFAAVPDAGAGLAVWVVGGLLALIGALCFAELAAAYPHSGGEYVYLGRAYGPLVSYFYAWAQLALIRPASIGAVAYIFAQYADRLWGLGTFFWTIAPVLVLTAINVLGVSLGKNTQNLLTLAKVLGLAAVVGAGLAFAEPGAVARTVLDGQRHWFAGSLILALWAYSGWHEAAYIAAEVKDNRRNLPLALILGSLGVMAIYLLFNGALLLALGFEGARTQDPTEVVVQGGIARQVVWVLIMVSALGAVNGMIFTTARIYSAFGAEHRLFTPLAHWSRSYGTPARALIVQGLVCLGYIVVAAVIGNEKAMFDTLVYLTSAAFYFFFLLTGIALFLLRAREPDQPRPFRVPLYPYLPVVFCMSCGYLIVGAILFAPLLSLLGFVAVLSGLPFYFLRQKRRRPPTRIDMDLVGAGTSSPAAPR